MQAGEIGPEQVGKEVSYGPGKMFRGIIAEVERPPLTWLVGWGLKRVLAPARIFLKTTDGRCVTLGVTEEVELGEAQEEGESG